MNRKSESCSLKVRVQPGASKTEIAALMADGSIKVKLRAPPVRGKANRELVVLLAGLFGVPVSSVKVVGGLTSRHKTVLVEGLSKPNAEELLEGRLARTD